MNKKRVKRLWSLLGEERLDALLITTREMIRYVTGFSGSESVFLLTKRGGCLIVDSRYTSQARAECREFTIVEEREKFKGCQRIILKRGFKKIGFEPHNLTIAQHRELRSRGTIELVALNKNIDAVRSVKDTGELKVLRKAARIASESFMELLSAIEIGDREIDVANTLEYTIKKKGAEDTPFPFIVASGKRGAYPHGVASGKKIRNNEFITVDFGAVYQGYCSDETCTIVVGKPLKRQAAVYQAVKEAHDRALDVVRPGKRAGEIDKTARAFLEQAGLGKYFRHGTGHGVGLAIHEEPRIAPNQGTLLEEDMVFTIEPGVYIPEWGGVRIEDTVRVTRGGCEQLSTVPKALISI
jgi:Xaa-Pro aminopeptidase